MDALNRSLSWDLSSLLAHTLRQIHRHGNAEDNLLTHMVSLDDESPYHIRYYFPHSFIPDIEYICHFLDITSVSESSTQNCRLIDVLLTIVIFTYGSLQDKSNFLFDWFHLSDQDALYEQEMVLLLSRIRFCLRKLGLKTLEFSLDELQHIAFISMREYCKSYPLVVSRLEFQRVVKESRLGKLLQSLVHGFRRINSIVNILSNRLSHLHSIHETIFDQEFYLPGPPVLLTPPSKLVVEHVLVTFFDASHLSLAIPRCCAFREIFLKVDRWHAAQGCYEDKTFAASTHRRCEVGDTGARNVFSRVDLDGLRPSTRYTVTAYSNDLHFHPIHVMTCPPPRAMVEEVAEMAVVASLESISNYTRIVNEKGQLQGTLKHRLIVYMGPICALEQV